MSTRERRRSEVEPDDLSRFDLACLYDDPFDPSELTIFVPEASARTTAWITADESTAVSLEECR